MDSRVDLDHLPIYLEIRKQPKKLASPFKLYFSWLKNEDVVQLIHSNWIPYQDDNGTRDAIHFTQNLIRIKKLLKEWAINKKLQDDQHIIQIEQDLKELQNKEGGGFLTQDDREKLYSLEASRTKLLMERHEVLRLKNRAIWMECGDDNTKLFQAFAKGRKQQNTIWELKNENNETVNTCEDLADIGKSHFENLFKSYQQATISKIIQVSQFFPERITE